MSYQGHHHMKKQCPILKPIVCDPVHVVKNHYHKAIQPIIHPVEIINKHHVIPVPKHEWAVVETDQEGQIGNLNNCCGPNRRR